MLNIWRWLNIVHVCTDYLHKTEEKQVKLMVTIRASSPCSYYTALQTHYTGESYFSTQVVNHTHLLTG